MEDTGLRSNARKKDLVKQEKGSKEKEIGCSEEEAKEQGSKE